MNLAKKPTPPHYNHLVNSADGHANAPTILSPEHAGCHSAKKRNLAVIIGQGVSCAKLRRMAETGIDACFPQQFALQAYRYNDDDERTAITNGNGCLIWVKIQSLGILPQGVYVHGDIVKAHVGSVQTDDYHFGGFPSQHRKHLIARILQPGTKIQFVHRGAFADGPVYQLYNPATKEQYDPYVPVALDHSEADRIQLLKNMIPLSNFLKTTAQ